VTVRVAAAAFAAGVAGCLEYSPHALPTDERHRDLNLKAIARLAATPAPEAVRFAIVGDTQKSFDEAEEVVRLINARDDVSFVIQAGDFTHLGLLDEFVLMHDVFRRLDVPYLVVVGVHEFFANGEDIFRRMYGPFDLAFTFGRVRVVLLDTNSIMVGFGAGVPDLGWLAAQIAPGPDHDEVVVVSHVAPGDPDFDPALRDGYHAALRDAGAKASIHAHAHRYRSWEEDGVQYRVADSVNHRSYLVVTARPGSVEIEKVDF
jgi:3',5'-cyclic AMP phosphodiesterase CpdA